MNRIIIAIGVVFSTLLCASCGADEPSAAETSPCVYKLDLQIDRPAFEATRAASGWERGDVIYLTFKSSAGNVCGKAEYTGDSWLVRADSPISGQGLMTAVYIDGAEGMSGNNVSLSEHSVVYRADDGSFFALGNSISATATMAPATSRVRFKGENGTTMKVYGISVPTMYNPASDRVTYEMKFLQLTVSGGYTPYIYGFASSEEKPRINVVTADDAFTRPIAGKMTPGIGGEFTVPSADSHIGWDNIFTFDVDGVEFSFIPVSGSGDFFLLGETELTSRQGNALKNKVASGEVPWTAVYYRVEGEMEQLLKDARNKLKLDVVLPSYDQWLYAARGGKYDSPYIYAGSDDINLVAWYKDNSGATMHDVAQLQPNRLGFYDMTGNAPEIVIDSEYRFMAAGGGSTSSADHCKLDNAKDYISTAGYFGVRLCVCPWK